MTAALFIVRATFAQYLPGRSIRNLQRMSPAARRRIARIVKGS